MPRIWEKYVLPGAASRLAAGAGGSLIAFDTGTGNFFYSSDQGATWDSRATPLGAGSKAAIAHDQAGLWVMTGFSGEISTSPDGAAWTSRTSGISTSLVSLAYGGGLWVGGGSAASDVLTSPDGVTWTVTSCGTISNPSGGMIALAHDGVGRFTGKRGVASGGPKLSTSTDGITWSNSSAISGFTGSSSGKIAHGNGLWVICEKQASGIPGILTSTDGVTFSGVTSGFAASSNAGNVAYFSHLDLWLAMAANGEVSASEDGGITWALLDLAEFSALAVTLKNGAGVASGGAVIGIDDTGGTPVNTAFVNLAPPPPPPVFWTSFVGCEETV